MFPKRRATIYTLVEQDAMPHHAARQTPSVTIRIEWVKDLSLLIEKVTLNVSTQFLSQAGYAADRIEQFRALGRECYSEVDSATAAVHTADRLRREALKQFHGLLREGEWDREWVVRMKELGIDTQLPKSRE